MAARVVRAAVLAGAAAGALLLGAGVAAAAPSTGTATLGATAAPDCVLPPGGSDWPWSAPAAVSGSTTVAGTFSVDGGDWPWLPL